MSRKSKPNPLQILHRLSLEFSASKDVQEVVFRVLNSPVALIPYHRAVLLECRNGRWKVRGVSGQVESEKYSELNRPWINIVRSADVSTPLRIDSQKLKKNGAQGWKKLEQLSGKLDMAAVPISPWGKPRFVLLLERWAEEWTDNDLAILKTLAHSMRSAFERFIRRGKRDICFECLFRKRFALAAVIAAFIALAFVRVPLRIVAPCEVVPAEPYLVTAPLDGVLEEVVVEPSQHVDKGDLLLRYDKRGVLEELEVAKRQVKMLQSSLSQSTYGAIASEEDRAELKILKYKLEQEKIRLELAKFRASQLDVRANAEGLVVLDSPDAWRGKPVSVGEKVLMVVDPENTKIRIWLPEKDRVDFSTDSEVDIVLNANPDNNHTAKLNYVAVHVTPDSKGVPSIPAEAVWTRTPQGVYLGMQGSAIIHGPDSSLLYYLLRKPLSKIRPYLG